VQLALAAIVLTVHAEESRHNGLYTLKHFFGCRFVVINGVME
jgi:hypothetical protein